MAKQFLRVGELGINISHIQTFGYTLPSSKQGSFCTVTMINGDFHTFRGREADAVDWYLSGLSDDVVAAYSGAEEVPAAEVTPPAAPSDPPTMLHSPALAEMLAQYERRQREADAHDVALAHKAMREAW